MCYALELLGRISMQIILLSLLNRWRNMLGSSEKGLMIKSHDVQYMPRPPAEFR